MGQAHHEGGSLPALIIVSRAQPVKPLYLLLRILRCLQIVIPFALCYDEYKQEGFCMVGFHSRLAKEGGERMSDYEIIMVILTVLSLVVVLITKDQK